MNIGFWEKKKAVYLINGSSQCFVMCMQQHNIPVYQDI